MLDTLLPCGDDFRDAHLVRNMSDDRQTYSVGLSRGCEVCIVRDDGLDFNEVGILLLE